MEYENKVTTQAINLPPKCVPLEWMTQILLCPLRFVHRDTQLGSLDLDSAAKF